MTKEPLLIVVMSREYFLFWLPSVLKPHAISWLPQMVAAWRGCATMADKESMNFRKEGRESSSHGVTGASVGTGTLYKIAG